MRLLITRLIAFCFLSGIVFVILNDSSFHFNKARVVEKRQHNSAMRHWSLFYGQNYIAAENPFKYQRDFNAISSIAEPGYTVISDRATSYYIAAALPLFVRNIHRHHGSSIDLELIEYLQRGNICYLHDDYHRSEFNAYLEREKIIAEAFSLPNLRYVILNKDGENSLLRGDCISARSKRLENTLPSVSKLLYSGEYLSLYQLNIHKVDTDKKVATPLPLGYLLLNQNRTENNNRLEVLTK